MEVVEALATLGVDDRAWRNGRHVDLKEFLRARLLQLGVKPTAIGDIDLCTASSPDLASHRRDGEAAGRQFSLIYRAATG
jgi:copper oxidase (laccase) domain-containing protein